MAKVRLRATYIRQSDGYKVRIYANGSAHVKDRDGYSAQYLEFPSYDKAVQYFHNVGFTVRFQ
jgi:viroplasmin and RNaseH domain-containing protein